MGVDVDVCLVKGIWIDERIVPELDDDEWDDFFNSDKVLVDSMGSNYSVLGKIYRYDVTSGIAYLDNDLFLGTDEEVFASINTFIDRYSVYEEYRPKSVDDIRTFVFAHYS